MAVCLSVIAGLVLAKLDPRDSHSVSPSTTVVAAPPADGLQTSEQPQTPVRTADAKDPPDTPPRQVSSRPGVLLREELKSRGIATAQEHEGDVVLRTADGLLIPLLADWRGRAFYQDERLQNRPVTLVGYLRPKLPYLQVLMVYTEDKSGTLQYTDYWCDICSIPMYEIKPCDCCQGEIRLRFQPQELPRELQHLPTNGGLTGGFPFPSPTSPSGPDR